MKRILLLAATLALLLFTGGQAKYAVVNNSTSGQTAHDSLSIPFFLLDSAGSQVAIASGDSVFLTVWYPGGALAFADSGAYDDADITSQVQGGMTWYSWQAQVSYLDGTPTEGTYSYTLGVHDKTGADLWTSFGGSFQLYATSDFDVTLDEIAATLDTLQNQDNWVAKATELAKALDSLADILDSLETQSVWIQDSLYAILDSLQLQDDWVAEQTELAKVLDSLADVLDSLESQGGWAAHQSTSDSLYDSLLIVLDSLEGLEAWVAEQAELAKALDSLADIIDSLESQDDWAAHQTTVDSVYDSLLIVLDSLEALEAWVALQAELDGLVMYFGACDGCYQILYPRGGTQNKDSVIVIDPSLGNDSLVGKIVFYHGTTPAVYDSSYFYQDEPW